MKLNSLDVLKAYNDLVQRFGRCTMLMLADYMYELGYVNPYNGEKYRPETLRYHLRRMIPNLKLAGTNKKQIIIVESMEWGNVTRWLMEKIPDALVMQDYNLTPEIIQDREVAGMSIPVYLAVRAKRIFMVANDRTVLKSDEDLDRENSRIIPFSMRFDYHGRRKDT